MSILTLTGIDENVSAGWIKSMLKKYKLGGSERGSSGIEFAMLRSPKVAQSPRYVTRETIRKITSYVYPPDLAFHLCGHYARLVLAREWKELEDSVDFSLIGRVQVNLVEADEKAIFTLQQFSAHIGLPVIMQWRGDHFPFVAGGVQLLQDNSGGRGILESNWIKPVRTSKNVPTTRIGFAGGLGPDNIRTELPKITKAAARHSFWIDCESSLRTNDKFDTAKAELMATAVWETLGWQIGED